VSRTDLRRGGLRSAALAGVLVLPCGLLLGALTALVALPCALVEGWLARQERSRGRDLAGVLSVWALAGAGCAAAFLQVVYFRAVLAEGSIAAGLHALTEVVSLHVLAGEQGPALLFYVLSVALAFALAASLRVGAHVSAPATLVALTGVLGALWGPIALGGFQSWLSAALFLAPCLSAGALPACLGLWALYACVDRVEVALPSAS